MLSYDLSVTAPLTTISDLRAWAAAVTAAGAGRAQAPRFLLSPVSRFGGDEWHLDTRLPSGLGRRVGGGLLGVLQRNWPLSARTAVRSYLTAVGILRLVTGVRATEEDAADADAEAYWHRL